MTQRQSISVRATVWITIAGAIFALFTFAHNGLSEVQKIPGMRADIDSLKAHEISDRVWKHDMAYMACANFEQSHQHEILAVCKSVIR